MKVKGWLHIEDCGDGGAVVHLFSTKELAQKSSDREEEANGYCLGDSVQSFEIEVDEQGNIIDTPGD